jgi:general secretion pathway protein E/type IV pilus assembly protein PilB
VPAAENTGKPPVRLGDKLVERGLISKDQLAVALQEKKNSPKMMGELLVDLGFITEQALSAVLAEDSGFERFDPHGSMVDPELLKMIPLEIANRYRVFPSTVEDKTARLAMADIYDVLALDQVKRYLPPDWEIQPLVCSDTEIQQAIDQYYGHELSIDGILRELDSLREGDLDAAALDDTTGGYTHPVVRLVNAILLDAVKSKASDIHFEPEGNFLRVRYRIDGMMMQVRTIHKQHWGAFSHRMKIMSGMNIADRLNPQDGRFSLSMANKRIDFRVSSLPTVHGENLVLRILDKSSAQVDLKDLGYSQHNFDMLTRMVKRPEGIIIVTGPTGSGKTTTLYAIMNYINSLDLNIMTLEDPVEFELSLIRQSQIREGSQMTFADGIRTLMRQDPDVILVGEVRDGDTAGMAVRAAMTGHQVYTTLHTNDAAGAIPRLMDLGLRPSLMAGNIIGVVAQRLGRKLCEDCRVFKTATEDECRILGLDPADPPQIGHAVGCSKCRGTGYRGRVGVSEILPFNDTIDEMIIAEAPLSHIREQARQFGFIPMVEDGIGKVLDGTMSIDALTKAVNITDRL